MLTIIAGGCAIIIFLCGLIDIAWKQYRSKLSFIPGPPTVPWIGTCPYLEYYPHKLQEQLQSFRKQFNHLYVLWFAHHPVIMSGKVEYAEVVLSSQEILTKSTFYWNLHEWLGTGLLTSNGTKWKTRRRAITPTFHFTILNSFVEIFEEQAKRLANKLQKHADTVKAIDIQVPVSLATLDVICETSMGVKVNAQDSSDSDYVAAVLSMNGHLQRRQRSPWLWPGFIYQHSSVGKDFYKNLNLLHTFTTGVINKRIQIRKDGVVQEENEVSDRKTKKFFLDMLLDLYDKGEIDVDGIREEVDTFMFEGHDTTASGLSWILYLLGSNPDIQEKLHTEIDGVSSNKGNILDKVRDLKYLEYVIKEGLRLHPPVPLFGRALEKDTVIDGNLIPKGTQVSIDSIGLHTNPAYWDDPYTFNPDRFGDEKFIKRNPYTYVPFSAGPRNCVGQKFAMLEEKILLFYIMSNFRLKSVQDEKDVQACIEIIHRSDNGLWIELCSR